VFCCQKPRLQQLFAVFVALRFTLLAAESSACSKEAESACPAAEGKALLECLVNKEKHLSPTKISDDCLDMLALHSACKEEIKDYCEEDRFSDHTVTCIKKWMDKGVIATTFFGQKCRTVFNWLLPRLPAPTEEKEPEDTGVYVAGENCVSRKPRLDDKVAAKGAQSASLADDKGTAKGWTVGTGEAATVIEIDEDLNFRLKNKKGEESGWAFRDDFFYASLKADEDPDFAEEKPAVAAEKKAQEAAVDPKEDADQAKRLEAAKMAADKPEVYMQLMADKAEEDKQKAELKAEEDKQKAEQKKLERMKAAAIKREEEKKRKAEELTQDQIDKAAKEREKLMGTFVAAFALLCIAAFLGLGYYVLSNAAPAAPTKKEKKEKKHK